MADDHHKQLVHRLVEIGNERKFDSIDEVASRQVASEARRWVGPFTDAFPDVQMQVVDVIAEDDKVVGRFKCSGTHQSEWRGTCRPVGGSSRSSEQSGLRPDRQPRRE